MLPFVGLGLQVQEKMEIIDRRGQQMIMRFCKLYSPEKIGKIMQTAQSFYWWQKSPVAAFMKAVGIVNKLEKQNAPI